MSLQLDITVFLRQFALRVRTASAAPVLGIYGKSGSGKTSLVETICGLRSGAVGRIEVASRCFLDSSRGIDLPPHRRQVGYVPQGSVLFPDRNVLQNIRSGALHFLRGSKERTLERRVIETFELEELLGAYPADLSGGEAQRVALGRAICSGARVLILDEPTASLGAEFRLKALPLLERVSGEFSIPMIVVSHEPLDLMALCEEVLVLARGQLISQGPPGEVLAQVSDGDQSFSNLLRGKVEKSDRALSTIALDGSEGSRMYVAGAVGTAGQGAFISFSANQVLISRSRPEGISALNVLESRVESIVHRAGCVLVGLRLLNGGSAIFSEITEASCARIELEVGCSVFAIVKAVSAWSVSRPRPPTEGPGLPIEGSPTEGPPSEAPSDLSESSFRVCGRALRPHSLPSMSHFTPGKSHER